MIRRRIQLSFLTNFGWLDGYSVEKALFFVRLWIILNGSRKVCKLFQKFKFNPISLLVIDLLLLKLHSARES